MKIIWTEKDRRHYEAIAWSHCKHLNAPRHVRRMLRDQLAKDLMARAEKAADAKTKEQTGVVVGGVGRPSAGE